MKTCKQSCKQCNIANYHMITNRIAIGDHTSQYDDFDIIVNLNYPYNYVKLYEISKNKINNKLIYNIGLYDTVDQPMEKILENIIPELENELKLLSHDSRILFHCYAGISRSSTLAFAMIQKLYKKQLVDIFKLAKSRRPQVLPNPGFVRALTRYTNDLSLQNYLYN